MGEENFEHVRHFLLSTVRALHQTGGDTFRFALVQYNSKPKTEFKLNTYQTTQGALSHIQAMSYDGGGTRTGLGLDFLIRAHLTSASGSRAPDGVTQIVVVLTDGRSQDDVSEPARVLQMAEVTVFAVGVQDAVDSELREMASEPYDTHVFSVESFLALKDIIQDLVVGLCGAVVRNRGASVVNEEPVSGGGTAQDSADLVLLIDGSQNVGAANFPFVRDLALRIIERLDVARNKIHVALALYNGNPDIKFYLNSYDNKASVLEAVKGLTFPGGDESNLGQALEEVSESLLSSNAGGRAEDGVPQMLVVITSGSSTDDTGVGDRALKRAGVITLGVAIGDSASDDLETVATDRSFVLSTPDFRTAPNLSGQLLPYLNGVVQRTIIFQNEITEALVVGQRDIIFLVDSTMGATLLNSVKDFIKRFVSRMPIGPDQVQVGVAQFTTRPQVEVDLNSYADRDSLADAVGQFRGLRATQTINIGAALDFVRTNMLRADKGSRLQQGVPQLVMLIASKRSSDSVDEAARALQQMGVLTLAVGSKAANEDELKRIAFTDSVVFMLKDFRALLRNPRTVVDALSSLSGSIVTEGPTETLVEITTVQTQKVVRDFVFLVDGSNYIGPTNFPYVRELIINIVNQLEVRPDRAQIGLVQYAEDPKIEFYLNSYSSREDVVNKINQLSLLGGSVLNTGKALDYALKNMFKPSTGSRRRQGVQQVLVLITGGPSQDQVKSVADQLALAGVLTFTVSSGQADSDMLRSVAFVPDLAYHETYFQYLPGLTERMMVTLTTVVGDTDTITAAPREFEGRDVAFLIDGTDSVRADFRFIKDFINKVIEPLEVSSDKVRVAVVQHSERPTPTFFLNTHQTKDDVIRAINNMRAVGGRSLNTGSALQYIQDTVFSERQGSRAALGIPQFLIVLTASRSRDSVSQSAGALKTGGVVPFGVGVKDADARQIEEISDNPSFAFKVRDFSELDTVPGRLNSYVSLSREELQDIKDRVEAQGPKKDIIFLVDGSDGVGREFPILQEFMRRIVETLNVGENKIRIGVVQYADYPQADMYLNSHSTKDSVLNAISGLRRRGGRQRNMGQALEFLNTDMITASRGSRRQEGVPQFVIAVSSGPSTDDIQQAAVSLKRSRVLPFSIGTRDVNPTELQVVSYVPNFAYTVDDLPGLYTVQETLINTLTEMSDEEIARLAPVFPEYAVVTPAPSGDVKRDVVFLIDGTTAVRSEFPAIREMIRRVVDKLDVGLDAVRIAVVQYSEDPKVEFLLNAHSTKQEVRNAVQRLRSRGGNILNTGRALEYVGRNIYQRTAGSRIEEGVPQFLILVTGGKSADDVSSAADQLKRNQIAPLAVGSRNADPDELKQISLRPEFAHKIDSFNQLPTVENKLLDSVKTTSAADIAASYVPAPQPPVVIETVSLGRKDVIFLIDGSDNTGAAGIAHIRDFIHNIVQQLDVQPDQVRVGIVQYADRVKTEFSLNSHNNKAAVLSAVKRLRQMGGRSSDLADAINYVILNELKTSAGMRPVEASQHLVVLTGGRSPQDVAIFGPLLKSSRVNCIGVGASGADSRQLAQIATNPEDVLQVPTFPSLPSLRERLISRLSGRIEEIPTEFGGGGPEVKRADIVFLVDGSINLGRDNFGEVMNFVINLIDLFYNDRDDLRFALAHYAADVTDVFFLNTYNNKDDIISAIGRAEYKGGRRINTGVAIKHVQDKHFIKQKGSRKDEGAPQILILITGGRSADDSKTAALGLKKTGVRIFGVGVGDIEQELENVASESSLVARAGTYQELSELNEQILQALDDELKGKVVCVTTETTAKPCNIEVLVGFDVNGQNIFTEQTNLQSKMGAILQRISKMTSISCSSGQAPSIQVGMLAMGSSGDAVQLDFTENADELFEAFRGLRTRGPFVLNRQTISAYNTRFKNRQDSVVKIVIHLTDGLDASYAEMKRNVDELQQSGVSSFILVGLERVPKFEEALLLEFGRGFRYTRPLRVNIMDLDYELLEEIDSIAERQCCGVPCKCTGTRGDRGGVGFGGPKGDSGLPGSQGHPGDEGGPGERGPPGVNGTQGFQGCPGPRGPKGGRGYSGEKGEDGELGLDGINGEDGKSGVAGPPGGRGTPGRRGPKGAKGQVGDNGEMGIRGDPGQSGRDNNRRGPKGDSGDPGPLGEQGVDGEAGQPGDLGRRGPNGRRGLRGEPGPPGTPGTVGEPGEPGIAGSRGPPGDKAPPGRRVRKETQDREDEVESQDHLDPKETRTSWSQGDPGPKGIQGSPGPRGEPGGDGVDGAGTPGPKGRRGGIGYPGRPGPKGDAGDKGTQGGPGKRGNRGQRGVSGTMGPPGQPGEIGYPGPYGEKGPRGPGVVQCDLVKQIRDNCPCCYGKDECPLYPTELAFAMDVSENVGAAFNGMRDTVLNLVRDITITESNCPRGARVALVMYNNEVTTEIRFADGVRKRALLQHIEGLQMRRTGKQRDLATAMSFVAHNTFKRVRSGFLMRKVAVFFVGGSVSNTQQIVKAALKLHSDGIATLLLMNSQNRQLENALKVNGTDLAQIIVLPGNTRSSQYQNALQKIKTCHVCFDPCAPDQLCDYNPPQFSRDRRSSITDADIDFAFVIDSSESTFSYAFTEIKHYISHIVNQLEVSSNPTASLHQARVSVIQQAPYKYFQNRTGLPIHIDIGLVEHKSSESVVQFLLEKTPQLEGGRALAAAIESTVEDVFEKAPLPRDRKVLMLFVTGNVDKDEDRLVRIATEVKCRGYFVVIFGVGEGVSAGDARVLSRMASEPSEVFFKRINSLSQFYDRNILTFGQLMPKYVTIENAFYMSPEVSKHCKWFQSDQPFKNPFRTSHQEKHEKQHEKQQDVIHHKTHKESHDADVLHVFNITSNSLKLRWSSPDPKHFVYFEVVVTRLSDHVLVLKTNVSGTEITVDNLQSAQSYHAVVTALTAEGSIVSTRKGIITTKTAEHKPAILNTNTVTSTTAPLEKPVTEPEPEPQKEVKEEKQVEQKAMEQKDLEHLMVEQKPVELKAATLKEVEPKQVVEQKPVELKAAALKEVEPKQVVEQKPVELIAAEPKVVEQQEAEQREVVEQKPVELKAAELKVVEPKAVEQKEVPKHQLPLQLWTSASSPKRRGHVQSLS
ncbi:hypothetical protein WMY93_002353 [Mugilogobius chulae]|uniref:Collagen alpha-3(VI) chain n=1 Tax=Mugilogobius chulae TaxID=88201 RepID=A0AAW0Q485_9GOBI